MTILATASSLREATSPEALTRARRRLLTAHPDPTRANTPTPGSLTDEQLRLLAAHDRAPPRPAHLTRTRSQRPTPSPGRSWPNRCAKPSNAASPQNAPHGTYDDTCAGHDAFSRGVTDDYDHGNHHLARATIRVADPGLGTCAGLSHLGLPDTEAPIIDELTRASGHQPDRERARRRGSARS